MGTDCDLCHGLGCDLCICDCGHCGTYGFDYYWCDGNRTVTLNKENRMTELEQERCHSDAQQDRANRLEDEKKDLEKKVAEFEKKVSNQRKEINKLIQSRDALRQNGESLRSQRKRYDEMIAKRENAHRKTQIEAARLQMELDAARRKPSGSPAGFGISGSNGFDVERLGTALIDEALDSRRDEAKIAISEAMNKAAILQTLCRWFCAWAMIHSVVTNL